MRIAILLGLAVVGCSASSEQAQVEPAPLVKSTPPPVPAVEPASLFEPDDNLAPAQREVRAATEECWRKHPPRRPMTLPDDHERVMRSMEVEISTPDPN
jgi:hypothetical protein